MKFLLALFLAALATPVPADPAKQNQAIDRGMEEAGKKADISMNRRKPATPRQPQQQDIRGTKAK